MIFVRRDSSLIPEKVLRVAERAQETLEALQPDQRAAFIEKKSHVWRGFARYLAKMSYGKCWYSESDCVQSFKDVDHYRPKKQAKRSETESDEGYPWLAFSWENFRLSAQRSNQINRDDDTDQAVGKGAWFPLMASGKRATWDDRCVDDEQPVLLDPTRLADVRLIEVTATGQMGASKFCLGEYERRRVSDSVKLLGLDLPGLRSARQRTMRLMQELLDQLQRTLAQAESGAMESEFLATKLPIDGQLNQLRRLTRPSEPYAAAARAQLRLSGFGELCEPVEQMELAA
jgi:hypothetical protein